MTDMFMLWTVFAVGWLVSLFGVVAVLFGNPRRATLLWIGGVICGAAGALMVVQS